MSGSLSCGGDGFKSPRFPIHGREKDCQSHQNVGQGASPGKQGGQKKGDVNQGADGVTYGKRAGQPGTNRNGYKLNATRENMTRTNVGNHSRKSVTLADFLTYNDCLKKAEVLVEKEKKAIISINKDKPMTSLICFNRFSALNDEENNKHEEEYEIINDKI